MCENTEVTKEVVDGQGYKVFGVDSKNKLGGDYSGDKTRPTNRWLDERNFRPSLDAKHFMTTLNWPYGWMIFMNKKDALYWKEHMACARSTRISVVRKVKFKAGKKATTQVRCLGARSNIVIAKQIRILP